jgi:hypothetical protein
MPLTFLLDDLDLEQKKFRQDRFSGSKVIPISDFQVLEYRNRGGFGMPLTFLLNDLDLDLEQKKFRQDRFNGSKVTPISVKCNTENIFLKYTNYRLS